MKERFYIYSKTENQDLTNYLRDLPNLDVFSCDKNKYMLEINSVYSEDFYALLNNIEYEFYLDIVIYNDKLLIEGKLLGDIKEYMSSKRKGYYTLGEALKDSIISNSNIKDDFKKYFESKLTREIIDTALAFIKIGNALETSKRLYIHRNTLNYRLDIVKRETSLDLKNFIDSFAFYGLMS